MKTVQHRCWLPGSGAYWNRFFTETVESFCVVVLERLQAIQDVHLRGIILANTDERQKHFLQER